MQGTNILQKDILAEWVEGVKWAKTPKAKQILRKQIAEKYGVGTNYVEGAVKAGCVEGLIRVGGGEKQSGRTWEVANYNEIINDVVARVGAVERKVDRFADGMDKGADAAEALITFHQSLRGIAQWMRDRTGNAIDFEDYPRLK